MRRCEDCINYKKNRPFGEWCKSKRRKQRVWPCAEKCSEYVPKWWKFWLYLFKISWKMMIYFLILLTKFIEYIIETGRVISIAKGWKFRASLCVFFELFVWAAVFKTAFLDVSLWSLEFIIRLMAYGCGAATGTYFMLYFTKYKKWTDKIKGTKDSIEKARIAKKPTFIIYFW